VYSRTPTARHGKQVALDANRTFDQVRRVARPAGNAYAANATATHHIGNHVTRKHRDASLCSPLCQRPGTTRPTIDDNHRRACFREVDPRLVGRVVVGKDDGALARPDGVATYITRYGRREHHARTVVVTERQWPLERALCEHDLPGTHPPQTLPHARALLFRNVVRAAFGNRQEIVIEIAEHGAAR
jgi:hypothetical protein